jgi:hypothetical protein
MRNLLRRWLGIPEAFDNVWIEMCRLQEDIWKLQGRDVRDYEPRERK